MAEHRHDRTSWILGGRWEWCYQCGAIRRLVPVPGTTNALGSDSGWRKPSGIGGPNPGDLPARRRRKP